jgi:hypothetical protein
MTARGIRNCNPGNIRRTLAMWQGQRMLQLDPSFVQFNDMAHGVRALAKTLLTYERKDGCNTIGSIISRWAPPTENNTTAYINAVAKAAGIGQAEVVDLTQVPVLLGIATGIILHENGADAEAIRLADLSQGIALALH